MFSWSVLKLSTIQRKITLAIVATILFFGTIATIFIYFQASRSLVEVQKDVLRSSIKYQSNNLSNIITTSFDTAHQLASSPFVVSYLLNRSTPQDESILNLLHSYNIGQHYSAIYLLNPQGKALVSTDPSFVGQDYSFRDYFQKSVAGQDYLGTAVGVTSKQLGYYFAVPIKSGLRVVGVLVFKMNPDHIHHTVFAQADNLSGNTLLTDKYGVVVHTHKPHQLYKSLGTLPNNFRSEINQQKLYPGPVESLSYQILQKSLSQIHDFTIFDIYDQVDHGREILIIGPVKGSPLYIVAEVDYSVIARKSINIAITLGLFVLIAAIAAALIVSWLISHFTSPLNQLTHTARLISQGRSTVNEIIIKTGDEIETLSMAVNQMVASLTAAKNHVEDQVKLRTAELEKLNKYMTGRELKMIELKKEIKRLRGEK